jgi:hypothetical protein
MARKKVLTFGELTGALRKLNYSLDPRQSGETYAVYRRRGRRLRVIPPALEDETPIRDIHIAAVRHTLDENSATDAERFDTLLNGHGGRKVAAS